MLGAPLKEGETRQDETQARQARERPVPNFHVLSVSCRGSSFYPRLDVDRENPPYSQLSPSHGCVSALSTMAVESVSPYVWTSARFSVSDSFQAWPVWMCLLLTLPFSIYFLLKPEMSPT